MLEAVPDPDETEAPEPHDLAAELLQQVTRWQRLADELREERDALRQLLAARSAPGAELRSELEARTSQPVLPTAHVVFVRAGARYGSSRKTARRPDRGTGWSSTSSAVPRAEGRALAAPGRRPALRFAEPAWP